ncbi:MAG: linear amide C-N hydrolase, partial [Caldisericaceae bacterium]|nr:linear amide C-N hydrolase [Caldisericaceae bacterium]
MLNEFQWVQYQLDNSKSVDEVIKSLDKITISPLLFKLHYMVCDQHGQVAIIEFLEGKIKVYTGDKIVVPVLTNNSYQNSLKYLRHYKGFGGQRTVSNGTESQERFVRAATLIKIGNKLKENDAFNILNSVKQADTQWSIVYNLSAKEI